MDAAMEAKLALLADQACRQACMSLAAGVCVDDGQVTGIAKVKTSRDAARWLLRNPAPDTPAAEAALMRAIAELPIDQLRPVLDTQASVRPIPGVVEVHPTDDLDSAELMRAFIAGRNELMGAGMSVEAAQIEWIWRHAEQETGIRRQVHERGAERSQTRETLRKRYARIARRIRYGLHKLGAM